MYSVSNSASSDPFEIKKEVCIWSFAWLSKVCRIQKSSSESPKSKEFFSMGNTSQLLVWLRIHCVNSSRLLLQQWVCSVFYCWLFQQNMSKKTHIHSTFYPSDFKWKRVIWRSALKTDLLDLKEPALKATTSVCLCLLFENDLWSKKIIAFFIYGPAVMHYAFWRCCKQAGAHSPLVLVIPCSTKKMHMLH